MKLTRTSLAEQGYLELARRIVANDLSGGTRLTEEGVSQELGISRTPVREALRRLAAEGLIEVLPRCGYRVAEFDREAARELFACRAKLEVTALESALPVLPEKLLTELRTRLAEAGPGELEHISLEVDDAIHHMIVDFCGNRFLREIVYGLIRRSAPFRNLRTHGDVAAPARERLALLNTLLERDFEKSAALLAAHIRNGGNVYMQ